MARDLRKKEDFNQFMRGLAEKSAEARSNREAAKANRRTVFEPVRSASERAVRDEMRPSYNNYSTRQNRQDMGSRSRSASIRENSTVVSDLASWAKKIRTTDNSDDLKNAAQKSSEYKRYFSENRNKFDPATMSQVTKLLDLTDAEIRNKTKTVPKTETKTEQKKSPFVTGSVSEADMMRNLAEQDKVRQGEKAFERKVKQDAYNAKEAEYLDLKNRDDFLEKSQYKKSDNPALAKNALYEYINKNEDVRKLANEYGYAGDTGDIGFSINNDKTFIEQMSDDEIRTYNYLDATEGRESANDYLRHLRSQLTGRQREETTSMYEQMAKDEPVASSIASVLMKPFSAYSYAGQAADLIATGEIDQNASYNQYSYVPTAVRNKVSENFGTFGKFAYQTGMSMADFLYTGLMTGSFGGGALGLTGTTESAVAQNLMLGIMGSNAAADKVIEAKDNGLDDGEAFALGTVAGVSEVLTEKVSVDALLDDIPRLGKNLVGYIAKNTLAEGSEEVASDLINLVADIAISKDKSEWKKSVQAYVDQGYTESEAFGLAMADQAKQMGMSFAGGALSGGFMGGGAIAGSALTDAWLDAGQSDVNYATSGAAGMTGSDAAQMQRESAQRILQAVAAQQAEKEEEKVQSTEEAAEAWEVKNAELHPEEVVAEAEQEAQAAEDPYAEIDRIALRRSELQDKADAIYQNGNEYIDRHTGRTVPVEEVVQLSSDLDRANKEYEAAIDRIDAIENGTQPEVNSVEAAAEEAVETAEPSELDQRVAEFSAQVDKQDEYGTKGKEAVKELYGTVSQIMEQDDISPQEQQDALTNIISAYDAVYTAGKTGGNLDARSVNLLSSVSPDLVLKAWDAGGRDAIVSKAKEINEAKDTNLVAPDKAGRMVAFQNSKAGVVDSTELVQAMNSGRLTKDTYDKFNTFGKITGTRINFVNKLKENAQYDWDTGEVTVSIDADFDKTMDFYLGHEFTHRLEQASPEEYQTLVDTVKKSLTDERLKKDAWTKAVEDYRALYNKRGIEITDKVEKNITNEVVADYVGQMLNTDSTVLDDFIRQHVGTKQGRTLMQRLRNFFREMARKFHGNGQSRKYSEVEKVLSKALQGTYESTQAMLNERQAAREQTIQSEAEELSDANLQYSVRQEAPPKKTGTAYKVFLAKNGQLYPPMVANPNGEGTPIGIWLNADAAPLAGLSKTGRPQVQAGGKGTNVGKQTLAYRPGWHLGDIPLAKQFAKLNPETGKKELFPENFVWAECEYAMDVDYQSEADEMGYMRTNPDGSYYKAEKYQHSLAGLKKIPKDGYYHYRTNPNPDTVPWVITGAMKVNRVLDDNEVTAICRENGVEPMQRKGGPIDLEALGFVENESKVQNSARALSKEITIGFGKNQRSYAVSQETYDFVEDRKNAKLEAIENGNAYFDAEVKLYSQYQKGVADQDTFYKDTIATFEPVNKRPQRKPDYVSSSRDGRISSEYWYTKDGVIRGSKHWGLNISSCDWKLNGYGLSSYSVTHTNKLYGKALWTDFILKTSIETDDAGGTAELTSFDGIQKANVQNSTRKDVDAEYMKAVESGDMDTAQRMVDEAAKKAGFNSPKVYHGTEADFTVFKPNEFLSEINGQNKIKGYFSETREYSESYGTKIGAYYVKIENPLDYADAPWQNKLEDWEKWFESKGVTGIIWDSSIGNDTLKGGRFDDGIYYSVFDLFDQQSWWGGDGNLTERIEAAGYDGMKWSYDEERAWIPFNEANIKSADPVTYDDNGNVIPLSERFNTENKDIRYSTRKDSTGKTLTQAQAEYFKDSKIVDENGNLLVVYHGSPISDITEFDRGKSGRHTGAYSDRAIWFTNSQPFAEDFAYEFEDTGSNLYTRRGAQGSVYAGYLNMTKPFDLTNPTQEVLDVLYKSDSKKHIDKLLDIGNHQLIKQYIDYDQIEDLGFDGVIAKTSVNGDEIEYGIFNANQIKSADNDNPTDSPDIRYSVRQEQEQLESHRDDLDKNGIAVFGDAVTKYSVRTWKETDIDELTQKLVDAGFDEKEVKRWIKDVNSVAASVLRDRLRLDYEADEHQVALKPNSEYYYTLDLSTLCKKRQLYQGTYNAIMHRLKDHVLMPEDTISLRRLMDDMGYEVPCGICYEESRKKNEGKFAKRWLNGYGKKWKGYKNQTHTDPYIPTLSEVTTTDGRAWLRKNHPEALDSYLQYQKTRGSANPKVSMTHTEYRGDIMNMSETDIEKVRHIGGLRLQSFSDFEIVHVIDMMQAVMDMTARNLTAQAYTKVPAFADIFGGTGIKINLSLIGEVDENGKLKFDSKEGMDPEEAFRLRDKYSKNVGTILVGANDASILAAWADPRIDMVIPFHRSGWSKKEFDNLGLGSYKDYTKGQTERYLMGKKDMALSTASKALGLTGDQKLEGIYPEDYWNKDENGNFVEKTGKENAEAYLKLCAKKHYRPVFYQFLHDNGDGSWSLQEDGSTDGYWKSLIDFKMYDNNGVGAPQREVTANFDMKAAKAAMDTFDGNPNTLPVAEDVVDKFVEEFNKAGNTQFSMRGSTNIVSHAQTVTETAAMQQRINDLQKEVENLKGELKSNKGYKANVSEAHKTARRILDGYGVDAIEAGIDVKELGDNLAKMANQLARTPAQSYEDVRAELTKLAYDIIWNGRETVDVDENVSDVKKIIRNAKIYVDPSVRNANPDFDADVRKAYMGKMTITYDSSKGQALDSLYDELSGMYPYLFPEDVLDPTEQLDNIIKVLDNRNVMQWMAYDEYGADTVEQVTNDLIDEVLTVAGVKNPDTFADKKNKQIAKARQKGKEDVKRTKAEMRQRIDRLRADKNAKLDEVKAYYREQKIKARTRRQTSEARENLLKTARDLEKMKTTGENRKKILQALGNLDSTARSISSQTLANLSDLRDWVQDMMRSTDGDYLIDSNTMKKLERLEKIERQITKAGKTLEEVIESGEGWDQFSTKDIDSYDSALDFMTAYCDVLKALETQIRNEKKTIDTEDKRDVFEQGLATISAVQNSWGINSMAAKFIDRWIFTEAARPSTEMLRIVGYNEDAPLYQRFLDLTRGQRNMVDYARRANERYFDRFTNDKEFQRTVSGKHAREIEITGIGDNGRPVTVKVTPDLLMSMYMHSQNDQNVRHIMEGGMTVPDIKLYKAGKINEAYDSHNTTKIRLKKSELQQYALNNMTQKERAFCEAAKSYYKTMSQPELNEVSEKLVGYEIAKVDNYYRIVTDPNWMHTNLDGMQFDGTIEGMGFTKDRVKMASNPVQLLGIINQVTTDIKMHSKYIGMAIPVRNFSKVLGVTSSTYNEKGKIVTRHTDSVQETIGKKWGDAANNYIGKMLRDLQNPPRSTDYTYKQFFSKVRSHYAGAVLTINASVAIEQAASYPTAAAVLGWEPLVKAITNFPKTKGKSGAFIAQYSPLMRLRMEGYVSQETGDILSSGKKLPKGANWIQMVDIGTVRLLWLASEYSVKKSNPDLKYGTKEFYEKVGELHTKVIEDTQPNYTELQRAQVLRSDSELVRMLNMFKTQPFQNFNILLEGFGQYRAKKIQYLNNPNEQTLAAKKEAGVKLRRAVTSQVAAAAVFAAMQWIWDLFRGKTDKYKDKEGEETLPGWLRGVGLNMLTSFAGMIPTFGNTLLEFGESTTDAVVTALGDEDTEPIFNQKYYGLDASSSLENINTLLTGAKKTIVDFIGLGREIHATAESGVEPDWEKYLRDIIDNGIDMAQFFGVPSNNIKNEVIATIGQAAKAKDGEYIGQYAMLRCGTGITSQNKKQYYELLYKAYEHDKDANPRYGGQYQKLYDMMIQEDGFATKDKTAQQNIDSKLAERGVYAVDQVYADQGISGDAYRDALAKYDFNENGNPSQDEVYPALNSMDLTDDQKEYLWSEYGWGKSYAEYDALQKKKGSKEQNKSRSMPMGGFGGRPVSRQETVREGSAGTYRRESIGLKPDQIYAREMEHTLRTNPEYEFPSNTTELEGELMEMGIEPSDVGDIDAFYKRAKNAYDAWKMAKMTQIDKSTR